MIYIRSFIFNILCYGLILLFSIITSVIGFFVPQKTVYLMWNNFVLVIIRTLLKWICGLKIEIRGRENIQKGAALYACKHQSAVETYFLTSYVKNSTYIFKKELKHIPFFGWAIHFYGSVPVDRSGGSRAMKKMLGETQKLLDQKRAVIIFPEGTRTRPGQTADYKPGAAFLYLNTDVPFIPIATNTGFFWKKNSFLRHPGKIIFEFMPEMPRGLAKKEFMTELQKRIEAKCAELNRETTENYPETKEMLTAQVKQTKRDGK